MPQHLDSTTAGAGILPPVLKQIAYAIGDFDSLAAAATARANEPFTESVVDFLDAVSKILLRGKQAGSYADVATLAFWCRRSSTERLMQSYREANRAADGYRLGRGLVFHIAPSNVAVNFAYSMVAGLLAGNSNFVRLPSRDFPQVDIICSAVENALQSRALLRPYVVAGRYGHEKEITDALSSLCDVRVMWGGDNTIREIRKSELSPRATEICFADRFSICVIDPDAYLAAEDKREIAHRFYNDTYLTDQNACTSPKLVVWLDEDARAARERFWTELRGYLDSRYELRAIQAVDKLDFLCRFAASHGGAANPKLVSREGDNLITRVEVDQICEGLLDGCVGSGFFFEYETTDLADLLPICSTKLQTVAVLGVPADTITRFIAENRPKGIDRVVPVGRTMDFSLIWDGYDLIGHLTRSVSVVCSE